MMNIRFLIVSANQSIVISLGDILIEQKLLT